MKWQEDIESTGITRADIARRESLSRARVTQIMSLLDLPEEMRASLLSMDEEKPEWSVREAMRQVNGK